MGAGNAPEWARLDICKCPHCPLQAAEYPYCPAARTIANLLEDWKDTKPYDKVNLECRSPQRTITAETTAQHGLSSLIGLKMATSECPHMSFFRPMARFHLPLSTPEEYSFRAITSYLLGQYFQQHGLPSAGEDVLLGLIKIYKNVEIVNSHIVERLQTDKTQDMTVSAVVILDVLSKVLPDSVHECLEDLRYLFEPFLQNASNQ